MAHRAETALVMPEKAKDTGASKRLSHVGLFSLLEVGFIGEVVGIRIPFHFDVSLDGCVTGVEKPNPAGLSLVVPHFAEEQPVPTTTLSKILLFAPACSLVPVSSSNPSPQTQEDFVIYACESAFTHDMPMIIRPTPYLGIELFDQVGGR
jgi:hypothetical protein